MDDFRSWYIVAGLWIFISLFLVGYALVTGRLLSTWGKGPVERAKTPVYFWCVVIMWGVSGIAILLAITGVINRWLGMPG